MNQDERTEHDLRSIRRWILRLRWFLTARVASDLSELDEREVESFPFEWADVVDRITRLGTVAEGGSLRPLQMLDFGNLVTELAELRPSTQGIRLRYPDIESLQRAVGQPATANPS